MDEENQTSSSEEQDKPEGTGQSPSPSTQGVHHHLPLHPQHDAAQSDANVISSEENERKCEYFHFFASVLQLNQSTTLMENNIYSLSYHISLYLKCAHPLLNKKMQSTH